MRLEDVQRLLAKRCKESGGQSAFAAAHGFTRQYVSAVLNGHKPPHERLCKVLGIRSDGERWVKG